MPLDQERISQLLEGHLQGGLTEGEQEELYQAVRLDEQGFRTIAEGASTGFTGESSGSLDPEVRETILNAIFTAGKIRPLRRIQPLANRWLRFAAAIIIIIGIGATLFYIARPKTITTPEL